MPQKTHFYNWAEESRAEDSGSKKIDLGVAILSRKPEMFTGRGITGTPINNGSFRLGVDEKEDGSSRPWVASFLVVWVYVVVVVGGGGGRCLLFEDYHVSN